MAEAGYADSGVCLRCGECAEDERHRLWHCRANRRLAGWGPLEEQKPEGLEVPAVLALRDLVPEDWLEVSGGRQPHDRIGWPKGWFEDGLHFGGL
eukprot:1211413-Alexandrium_andersonii.AAC.1